MASILESMGSKVVFINNNSINIDNSSLDNPFASYDLVRTMRASFYVLGRVELCPWLGFDMDEV